MQYTSGATHLQVDDHLWQKLYLNDWGEGSSPNLTKRAVAQVGSYKKLYADKVVSERAKAPWEGLSSAERNAAVAQMMDEAGDNDMAMMFLVDGSGSVSQGDGVAVYELCTMIVNAVELINHILYIDIQQMTSALQWTLSRRQAVQWYVSSPAHRWACCSLGVTVETRWPWGPLRTWTRLPTPSTKWCVCLGRVCFCRVCVWRVCCGLNGMCVVAVPQKHTHACTKRKGMMVDQAFVQLLHPHIPLHAT